MSKVKSAVDDRETRISFSRRRGETLRVGNAVIQVIGMGQQKVRLLIRAPRNVRVVRGELEGIQSNGGTDQAERVDS